jgi:hypothetical protein
VTDHQTINPHRVVVMVAAVGRSWIVVHALSSNLLCTTLSLFVCLAWHFAVAAAAACEFNQTHNSTISQSEAISTHVRLALLGSPAN